MPELETKSLDPREGGLLATGDYEEVGPPTGDSVFWDQEDYVTIRQEGGAGILGGNEKTDDVTGERGMQIPQSSPVYVSVEEDSVLATFPAEGKRYIYPAYSTVLVTVAQGIDSGSVRDALSAIGAVVLDEADGRLLVVAPANSSDQLDRLVQDGLLSSYEEGGWGSGFGKA